MSNANSNRNTIIQYLSRYFILPRDPPSEIGHLGEEARRRYNWHIVLNWYNESKAGRATKLSSDGSANKFTDLSNNTKQALIFSAIENTLRDISPHMHLDTDSGRYHMPTDNNTNNPHKTSKLRPFVENING